MISSVTGLLKGKSTLEASGWNLDKLKYLEKIKVTLHIIKSILIFLGATLIVLGATGVLGIPALVAGGILLMGVVCGSLLPLFIRLVKRHILFKRTWNELAETLQKLEKEALNNPELSKFLVDCKKNVNTALSCCEVERFSKDFYMPLLLWSIVDRIPKTLQIGDADKIFIQACYLILIQGLKRVSYLIKIPKNHWSSRERFQQDRETLGKSFSDASIALSFLTRNSGMQVVRGGLNSLYRAYLSFRKSVESGPFMTPGTLQYSMRTLYNDALAQCAEIFPVGELKNLNSIKNEKIPEKDKRSSMINGDFIIQALTHPDNGQDFTDLQLLSSDLGRGGGYDFLFG